MLLAVGLSLSLSSCNPARKYEKAERESIDNYFNQNDTINFELKPSGLYYHEVVAGTGRAAMTQDTAYVTYTGMFLDGTVFNTNVGGTSLIFPVNEGYLITGFDEGITYMKEGGKSMFLIPSSLAYGPQGYLSIGGYTPLLYNVELVHVVPGPAK